MRLLTAIILLLCGVAIIWHSVSYSNISQFIGGFILILAAFVIADPEDR